MPLLDRKGGNLARVAATCTSNCSTWLLQGNRFDIAFGETAEPNRKGQNVGAAGGGFWLPKYDDIASYASYSSSLPYAG